MSLTFNPVAIAERCGWDLECISNSLAALLIALLREGKLPPELASKSAFKDLSTCRDDYCELSLRVDESLIRELLKTYSTVFRSAYERLLRNLSSEELTKLLQLLVDNELDDFALEVDYLTDINKVNAPLSLRAQLAEQIATLLYASGNYERARERFLEAGKLYEEAGLSERSLLMRAFAMLSEAELLKERAAKLHEENNHVEEEKVVKTVSRIYAETSVLFKQASRTIPEASVNALLSRCDAHEVLANFYFTHGQVEEAEKYYTMCFTTIREEREGLSEVYRKLVEYKEMTCKAFAVLCKAIMEGKSHLYEEAGDAFSKLVEERYLEDVMVEMATIAYRSAIETAESLDDVLRVYPKYINLVIMYIDRRAQDKYGGFEHLLQELKVRPLSSLSDELRVDEYALKIYVAGKLLQEIAKQENTQLTLIPELLTLIAGLSLDPLSTSGSELRAELLRRGVEIERETLNTMCRLLDKLSRKVREIILGAV